MSQSAPSCTHHHPHQCQRSLSSTSWPEPKRQEASMQERISSFCKLLCSVYLLVVVVSLSKIEVFFCVPRNCARAKLPAIRRVFSQQHDPHCNGNVIHLPTLVVQSLLNGLFLERRVHLTRVLSNFPRSFKKSVRNPLWINCHWRRVLGCY